MGHDVRKPDCCMHESVPLFFFFLENIMMPLGRRKILIILVVSVSEQTGFSLTLSKTPKVGFLAKRPIQNILSYNCLPPDKRGKIMFYLITSEPQTF